MGSGLRLAFSLSRSPWIPHSLAIHALSPEKDLSPPCLLTGEVAGARVLAPAVMGQGREVVSGWLSRLCNCTHVGLLRLPESPTHCKCPPSSSHQSPRTPHPALAQQVCSAVARCLHLAVTSCQLNKGPWGVLAALRVQTPCSEG